MTIQLDDKKYFFTTLDLYALDFVAQANITAFHVYEPNDTYVTALLAEFNLKNMVSRRPQWKFMTVSLSTD